MKKLTTKQIATGGVLLAIMIISMLFKNTSVYISGPIVNTCLVLATLALGPVMGIILSCIAPIASFIITGSPVVAACPYLMIPAIAIGNIIICICTYVFYKNIKKKWSLPVGLIAGSVAKAAFMGATISNFILVTFCKSLPEKAIAVAKTTFSITQLFTSLIASVLICIIWWTIGKSLTQDK